MAGVAAGQPGLAIPAEPPARDLFDLAHRLRPPPGGSVPRTVNSERPSYETGHTETFFVVDLTKGTVHTVQATLQVVSEHAYWYVDDSLSVRAGDLSKAAQDFEAGIHPAVTGSFGDIWNPGVDNDPRLTILNTPLNGAAGYYGSQDEYPRAIHPHSNEREIIYMDASLLRPGTQGYLGVIAHELQHAVHWSADAGEDAWINEGMSEVAKDLAGYGTSFVDAFLQRPAIQLNYWPKDLTLTAPHYGAATLFMIYLAQHYGGYEGLKSLAEVPQDGVNGVEAYLARYGKTFLEVFEDWVVANYLGAPEGKYGYGERIHRIRKRDLMTDYGEKTETLPQLSASYSLLRLERGDAVVRFQGDPEVHQLSTQCHSGRYCWWSNRGDSIDSTLTREFDLTALSEATLEFWTWFDVEEGWDYGYVEVSPDGGATWTILEGSYTSSENPVGNSYGHGFTGRSEEWVQESIDLTRYVGRKVLLRFEYITDDGVFLDGFVIDDIAIPELGFFDDAEKGMRWDSHGFVRTNNRLPQRYVVQVIERRTDGTDLVREISLDENKEGEITVRGFGSELREAVIIVSPATPNTHQPARHTLTVSAAGSGD